MISIQKVLCHRIAAIADGTGAIKNWKRALERVPLNFQQINLASLRRD